MFEAGTSQVAVIKNAVSEIAAGKVGVDHLRVTENGARQARAVKGTVAEQAVIEREGKSEFIAILEMNTHDFTVAELHVAKDRVVQFHETQVAVGKDAVDKQAGGKIRALQIGVLKRAVIIFSLHPFVFVELRAREGLIGKHLFHALKITTGRKNSPGAPLRLPTVVTIQLFLDNN